jgi:hypothetical protein
MKNVIRKIPVLRSIARSIYLTFIAPFKPFPGSENYWKQRYESGGTSGAGSYHRFAEFKAEILNDFVEEKQIRTVIEYGCGDGNQLELSRYPSYIGLDVSLEAISRCRKLFSSDDTKTFKLMAEYVNETAELTLSLDVIYHLIEDDVFFTYMRRLFDSSTSFVIIYSSNINKKARFQVAHMKHRRFSEWIEQNRPEWTLVQLIPNRYPHSSGKQKGSRADFYIYEKALR